MKFNEFIFFKNLTTLLLIWRN